MANPLNLPAARQRSTSGPVYGTQEWCDWRNHTMERDDIEWIVIGPGTVALTDLDRFMADNTRRIAKQRERERHDWKWRRDNWQDIHNGTARQFEDHS